MEMHSYLEEGQVLKAAPVNPLELRAGDIAKGYRKVALASIEAKVQAPFRELKLPPEHWNYNREK